MSSNFGLRRRDLIGGSLTVNGDSKLGGTGDTTVLGGSLTVNEDTVIGDITVNGQFILKDHIMISVPLLVGGADLFKPTIQEAIDYFAGRHTMNGTILIAAGQYHETLSLNKISSAFSKNNSVMPYDGFSIIGDTRLYVGSTYLQGGYNSNNKNVSSMGTAYAIINLVNGTNTIQVTGPTGLDFIAMGVVVGDAIKIRDNTPSWNDRLITGRTSDTLTYSGSPLTVGGVGSAFILCPDVEILGSVASDSPIFMSGCIANLQGLWCNTSVARGAAVGLAAVLSIQSASAFVLNCLFDNATNNLLAGQPNVEVIDGALIGRRHSTPDELFGLAANAASTIIGSGAGNFGLFMGTGLVGGIDLNVFDASNGIASEQNMSYEPLTVGITQIVNCGTAVILARMGRIWLSRFMIVQCFRGLSITDGSYALIGRSGVPNIINSTSATNSYCINVDSGSYLRVTGPVALSNANVGVLISRSSTVNLDGAASIFSFSGLSNTVVTENLSTYNAMLQTLTLNNVFTNAVGTNIVMENSFPAQLLGVATSAPPVTLTMNPAAATIFGYGLYLGKTFTISSLNGAAHTLTLSGTYFKRFGNSPDPSTVATFGGTDSFLTFHVENATSVRVLNSAGVTFS